MKFVVRLLDREGALLAWTALHLRAEAGRFVAPSPTRFLVERAGEVAEITVHWTDLDIARREPVAPLSVQVGQAIDFTWHEPVWAVSGQPNVPLPAVTLHAPVTLTVPAGTMGARAT